MSKPVEINGIRVMVPSELCARCDQLQRVVRKGSEAMRRGRHHAENVHVPAIACFQMPPFYEAGRPDVGKVRQSPFATLVVIQGETGGGRKIRLPLIGGTSKVVREPYTIRGSSCVSGQARPVTRDGMDKEAEKFFARHGIK